MNPLDQKRIHEVLQGDEFEMWAGEVGLPLARENAAPWMVWTDMETTGLSALNDVPLEAGIVLTDRWGRLIRDGAARWLIFDFHDYHWTNRLGKMQPTVREMHEKSGLMADLTAVAKISGIACPPSEAEKGMVGWLHGKFGRFDGDKLPPCGSSIGFDRKFMELWMPDLYEWFHYRNGDVSSWRYFVDLHRPDITAAEPEKQKAHRVLPDIVDSIKLYRHLVTSTISKEA